MKEHPLLFKAEMILALLNTKIGTWPPEPIDPSKPFKWQTRRPLSENPTRDVFQDCLGKWYEFGKLPGEVGQDIACKWKNGDQLWAKETFGVHKDCKARNLENIGPGWICYQADGGGMCPPSLIKKWKPSIFMRRVYSSIQVELMEEPTSQRVNEISEADAKAEGVTLCPGKPYAGDPHRCEFRSLWDSIHGQYPSPFLAGPYVWKLSFRRIK